jgi:hypothetical protein
MKKDDLLFLNSILSTRNPKSISNEQIDKWKKKYELVNFKYINTLQEFSELKLGNTIKPINIKTNELKSGGIVIKIDKNKKNKWYALLSIPQNKYFWKVYFDDNYIFYNINVDITRKKMDIIISAFISQNDINKYTIDYKNKTFIDNILKKYNKIN